MGKSPYAEGFGGHSVSLGRATRGRNGVEAEGRIELPHIGFANRCITTLLLGRTVGACM